MNEGYLIKSRQKGDHWFLLLTSLNVASELAGNIQLAEKKGDGKPHYFWLPKNTGWLLTDEERLTLFPHTRKPEADVVGVSLYNIPQVQLRWARLNTFSAHVDRDSDIGLRVKAGSRIYESDRILHLNDVLRLAKVEPPDILFSPTLFINSDDIVCFIEMIWLTPFLWRLEADGWTCYIKRKDGGTVDVYHSQDVRVPAHLTRLRAVISYLSWLEDHRDCQLL